MNPIVATRLHAPRRRREYVPRPRLRARLDRQELAPLTLVSAPAGFGKTSLVADWFADRPGTAWLSLDRRDRDAAQVWAYVVAALRGVEPDVGGEAAALLGAGGADLDAVVASLLNDLATVDHELVLVLDDYHVVESPAAHEAMAFLVEHLPQRVHVVIASRTDPPLPLAAWRARGDLLEFRAADLRFTADEAASYLNDVLGLALDAEDVARLEGRTEGWIAALQLAALSLEAIDDRAGFIAGFAGDDRFILDYLVDEVLDHQAPDQRAFLLMTSVLNRLTGALCDAVTERADGRATLEALDRSNLFVVPLDDRRTWYRYHHLFADVLRARLLDEDLDLVPVLHRRAAAWFEAAGERDEAIAHALAAGDAAEAARMIELAAPAMRMARQEQQLRRWLEELPSAVYDDRPVLCMALVGARMSTGDLTGASELMDRAEARMASSPPPIVHCTEDAALFAASIAVHRAGVALQRGDLAETIDQATRVLELIGPDDHLPRGSASALIGLAHWAVGDLAPAAARYEEAVRSLLAAGHIADALGCLLGLADIELALGHLDAAEAVLRAGLDHAAAHPGLRGAADMHVALAEIAIDRDDLVAAERALEASRSLGEAAGLPQHGYRSRVAAARLCEAQGVLDGAIALLDEAAPRYDTDYSPAVRPVAALRTRVLLARGQLAEAERWVAERGLAPDDELAYVREFEHLTLARVLLARAAAEADPDATLDQAEDLLDRLLAAAQAGGRGASAGDARALLTRVRTARGEDGGPPARPPASPGLIEPLSARELDVLRLLRSDLSGPDIARELYVSLNTLRTHTKHIYAKLGVTNRREAVTRAAELGL